MSKRKKQKKTPSTVFKMGRIFKFFLLCLLSGVLFFWANTPSNWPIQLVRVKGDFGKIGQERIQQVAEPFLEASFVTLNLQSLQLALLQLPWVSTVNIARFWPDTLEIVIHEEKARVLWNENKVFNAKGELFQPQPGTLPKGLPHIKGPTHLSQEAFESYQKISQLLKEIGLNITYLNMDEKASIEVNLNNGLKLVLGAREPLLRLRRFLQDRENALGDKLKDAEKIDLRYPSGFAVSWKKK